VDTSQSLYGRWRAFAAVAAVVLAVSVLISACSDDPVLGPSDGESDGGGSYSVIKELAQPDTVDGDSLQRSPPPENPERF